MSGYEIISEKEGGVSIIAVEDGKRVAKLNHMDWESDFFGRRFGKLEIPKAGPHLQEVAFDDALKSLLLAGDKCGFDLIALDLDISLIDAAWLFEDNGFRTVDAKVTFLTVMKKSEIDEAPPDSGEICFVSADMEERILELTHQSFTDNPLFKSRFTNRRYFSHAESRRYYAAWIENHIRGERPLFAVMKDAEGKPAGYLIYERTGEYQGKPLYRGVLVAVAPEHRGKKMHRALQSFVYRQFSENEVCLTFTTQLANLSAMRNYIRPHTILDHAEIVLYRLRSEGR